VSVARAVYTAEPADERGADCWCFRPAASTVVDMNYTTLLTFEVHEGTAPKADADRLRGEIETSLRKKNWEDVGIHTTYKKGWSKQPTRKEIKTEFLALVLDAMGTSQASPKVYVQYAFHTGEAVIEQGDTR
jgi:hypothetical protein